MHVLCVCDCDTGVISGAHGPRLLEQPVVWATGRDLWKAFGIEVGSRGAWSTPPPGVKMLGGPDPTQDGRARTLTPPSLAGSKYREKNLQMQLGEKHKKKHFFLM